MGKYCHIHMGPKESSNNVMDDIFLYISEQTTT